MPALAAGFFLDELRWIMKLIQRGIALLFGAGLIGILALILLAYDGTAFWMKRTYLAPQMAMLGMGMAFAAALCGAVCVSKAGGKKSLKWTALLPWAGLVIIQLVLCFHAYFITGWDVRGIVDTAYAIAGGEADMHHAYLSQYPNNIPLVLLFAAIIRAVRMVLGNPGMDRCIYVLIAFQCAINTLTGMLLQLAARKITGSSRVSWCVAAMYMIFVGLSPWLMIPYSDSVALFFPTAMLLAYAYREDERVGKWVWPGIGLLTGIGYMIKPQVLIAVIAISIVETARQIAARRMLAWIGRVGCMALVTVLLAVPGMQLLIKASPIEMREGRSMNMLHYVMMGLNSETNGSYLYDDVVLTYHAEDKPAAQLPVIRERLSQMGTDGFAEHLKKKTLTNYADGSFAWACEGEFYREWIEDKDEYLSPYLKSIIYTGGSRFKAWQTGLQSIWLALLAGCVLCALRFTWIGKAAREHDALCVMMLCVIGITMFQTIFEARARYLYLYAPFYVMLGVCGIYSAVSVVLKRMGKSNP